MRDLRPLLEDLRSAQKLPALAAAVVSDKNISAAGAVGERKIHSGVRVTLDDKFHIGSCTKSMTALLAVSLANDGIIQLGTKVREVFPEWDLDDRVSQINLTLLLQNLSGLSGQPSPALWTRAFRDLKGRPDAQRRDFLREFLKQPLDADAGTKYIYSNIGFALAGAMLEQRAHKTWEELIVDRVFHPLCLSHAGFGAPANAGTVDQPWGHQLRDDEIAPIDPHDNPLAIAPAGAVHLSVLDAARYAAFHLANFNAEVTSLNPRRDQMYTPPVGVESDYAFGWIVQTRPWAGGKVLTHAGSNTMFYTVFWIAPARKLAFVVMTNIGEKQGSSVSAKCDRVVAALIKEFAP